MGVFDYTVVCIVGDYGNVEKYLQWKYEDNDKLAVQEIPRGTVFLKPGYVPVLWIPRLPKTVREFATVGHEALHCVFHLFRWAKIPIDDSTEEVVAHSTAHIINEILSSMGKGAQSSKHTKNKKYERQFARTLKKNKGVWRGKKVNK